MTTLPATTDPTQAFDEDAWDDLLNYIEEHRVVPIIGPDLLRVQTLFVVQPQNLTEFTHGQPRLGHRRSPDMQKGNDNGLSCFSSITPYRVTGLP